MKEIKSKSFANGSVHALVTDDGYPVEVTDTFLPFYTKDAVGRQQNALEAYELGDRSQRWMVGISCMSGCPVRCQFCATGQLKRCRNLTAEEMVEQVRFVLGRNPGFDPTKSREFKVNYTRMGEPFLNIDEVRRAVEMIDGMVPNVHHYISTIGVRGADFGWIRGNITLQVSLHSLDDAKRDRLIPFKRKLSIDELGTIRTLSNLKTTLNMTLVEESDFDIERLKRTFDRESFFVKLSPINTNCVSEANGMGAGVIDQRNLV